MVKANTASRYNNAYTTINRLGTDVAPKGEIPNKPEIGDCIS